MSRHLKTTARSRSCTLYRSSSHGITLHQRMDLLLPSVHIFGVVDLRPCSVRSPSPLIMGECNLVQHPPPSLVAASIFDPFSSHDNYFARFFISLNALLPGCDASLLFHSRWRLAGDESHDVGSTYTLRLGSDLIHDRHNLEYCCLTDPSADGD